MAKARTSKPKKKRAPFLTRFTARITKFNEWVVKMTPKFESAPKTDVSEALANVGENLSAAIDALPKLGDWAPPARSPAFAVGDTVTFKKDKLDEQVKAGLYEKSTLSGSHEILAIAGRKVKLACGVFQSLYVTKSA